MEPNVKSPHLIDVYGDPHRTSRIFYWFIAVTIAALAAGIVITISAERSLLPATVFRAASLGAAIPVMLAAVLLVRGRHFESAALFLALALLGLGTVVATQGVGIHSISNIGFPAILITASMVTRKRTMAVLVLAAIGCIAWLVFGELGGAYRPTVLVRSVPGDFFTATMIVVVTAVMARLPAEALFQGNRQLTAELRERTQIEAQREALIRELEAKNAELERFTYTVSHDLKAPLITIGGFLGHLERAAATGDRVRFAEDLRRIEEAVRKMHGLLGELLELSRVGRLVNPPQTVPFAELAREAVALARGRLEARGVEVTIAEGLPEVRGDRPRLVEVLQNLLDNAAKFMGPQPRPRVEIGARAGGPDGPVFSVRDNGAGIAPEFHERVFGLFTRLDPSIEGSGIGLALVQRIVEVHGGRIWVESEGVGKGSTFLYTLPGR